MRNPQVFANEYLILSKIDHPNIVNIIEIWEWGHLFFIVMEYCSGGELFTYMAEKKTLEEHELHPIMKQVTSILIYLEKHQISHRDMKMENFLLKSKDSTDNIKLVDFGLA